MSPAARGIYRDLLDFMWDSGIAALPDDEILLRKYANCTEAEWRQHGKQILENFVPCGENLITNPKMAAQWKERKSFLNNMVKRGQAGAKKRWHKHGTSNGTSNAKAMLGDSSASASASASAVRMKKEEKSPFLVEDI
jgi:uncharacterized protein YdaU (DUF1376 family)